MAKEGTWDYGLIDDNGILICIQTNTFDKTIDCPDDVLSECVKANYNVTKDKIIDFKWLGIKWDYAQLICWNDNDVEGLRLVLSTPFLNPYYKVKECLNNPDILKKHFHAYETHHMECVENFRFYVDYEPEGEEYKIKVDIIHRCFCVKEMNEKPYAEYIK